MLDLLGPGHHASSLNPPRTSLTLDFLRPRIEYRTCGDLLTAAVENLFLAALQQRLTKVWLRWHYCRTTKGDVN